MGGDDVAIGTLGLLEHPEPDERFYYWNMSIGVERLFVYVRIDLSRFPEVKSAAAAHSAGSRHDELERIAKWDSLPFAERLEIYLRRAQVQAKTEPIHQELRTIDNVANRTEEMEARREQLQARLRELDADRASIPWRVDPQTMLGLPPPVAQAR